MHKDYHVFFSYARKDNEPDHSGWVTRFRDALLRQHEAMTGRPLEPFFDRKAIDSGQRWKFRLGEGLRRSRLFLAFLSQNYLDSAVCRWEWEQYLMLEHSAARGDDGIVPLYFVQLGELDTGGDPVKERWLADIQERHLGTYCDLQPWFEQGQAALAEMDAADRIEALREADRAQQAPESPPERVAAVNLRLSRRLDRIWLADQVIGNVERSYEHFRGRHGELRQLHEHLINGRSGLITATHGPGGLGKSALARQYAVAYADFYAAGGIWEIGCAGRTRLGEALFALQDQRPLRDAGFDLGDVREADADTIAQAAFEQLRRITESRRDAMQEQLRTLPERRTPDRLIEDFNAPRCLLILDNVDRPELLSAQQRRLIPDSDWLEIVVTTRCNPSDIGAASQSLATVEVGPLPEEEGVELLRSFMPGEDFPSIEEEEAARALVREVGGYTLVLELIGAYLAVRADEGAAPSQYLGVLRNKGLAVTDSLGEENAETAQHIDHEQKQVAAVLDDTLEELRRGFTARGEPELADAAITALEFASLLQPDAIPTDWLQQLVAGVHPDAMAERDDGLPAWGPIWKALYGRRLLQPALQEQRRDRTTGPPALVRLHRLIGAHLGEKAREHEDMLWSQLKAFLAELGQSIEHQAQPTPDDPLFAQYPALRDHLFFLLHHSPERISLSIIRQAKLMAELDRRHLCEGSARPLLELVRGRLETSLSTLPRSPELHRDLYSTQTQLGDIHRNLADGESARYYYESALETLYEI